MPVSAYGVPLESMDIEYPDEFIEPPSLNAKPQGESFCSLTFAELGSSSRVRLVHLTNLQQLIQLEIIRLLIVTSTKLAQQRIV